MRTVIAAGRGLGKTKAALEVLASVPDPDLSGVPIEALLADLQRERSSCRFVREAGEEWDRVVRAELARRGAW